MLSWNEVLAAAGPIRVDGRPVPRIWGLAHDSRRIRPGDAFVAVRGNRHDGHHFLAEAVERGAGLAVVEEVPGRFTIPLLVVKDSRAALPRLSSAFYRSPTDELELVGVTGSMGKTSVSQIVAALHADAGDPVGVIGSLGVQWRFSWAHQTSLLTTPESTELQQSLRAMADRGQSGAVLEMTSHSLHYGRVDGIRLAFGVVTNLYAGEHTDLHPTFDHYVATKHSFAGHLRPGATLWVNGDDPLVAAFPAGRAHKMSFGQGADCDLRAEILATGPEGTHFRLHVGSRAAERLPTEAQASEWCLSLLGRAQVMNALPALAVALETGVPVGSARDTLSRLRPFYRRAEVLYKGDFTVLDEMPHHPAAVDALFNGLVKDWPYRRLHVLYGLRGGRGVEINTANADRLVHWLRSFPPTTFLYTISRGDTHPRDVATDEEQRAVRTIFERECDESTFRPDFRPDLEQAVATLLEAAQPGDLCLILGAQGMDHARHYVWEALGRPLAMKS